MARRCTWCSGACIHEEVQLNTETQSGRIAALIAAGEWLRTSSCLVSSIHPVNSRLRQLCMYVPTLRLHVQASGVKISTLTGNHTCVYNNKSPTMLQAYRASMHCTGPPPHMLVEILSQPRARQCTATSAEHPPSSWAPVKPAGTPVDCATEMGARSRAHAQQKMVWPMIGAR